MATNTSNRGFASMDEEKQREIARKGGESVPAEKRSFSKDPELASEAGQKGGQSVPDEKRSFSKDHELASEAGRKGGHASGGNFANDPERASEAGRKGGDDCANILGETLQEEKAADKKLTEVAESEVNVQAMAD
jgi:uncharacterized protein